MPIVKMSEFELDRVNSFVTSSALHTHRVRRGHLIADPSKDYIRKEASDFKMAQRELLAQEFFRLIIPEQPETRLLIDIKDGVEEYYLLSEEIKDWQELPLDSRQSFADGTFTGLGQVLLTALFLQESDLKNGNIGLGPLRDDGSRPVRKIDGDWCFSKMRNRSRSYAFDTKTIQRLPQLTKDYQAYNWLDLVRQGVLWPRSNLIDFSLCIDPRFRAEVNEAIFKICMLPDTVIDAFVTAYMPASREAPVFMAFLKARRDALFMSAVKEPSFSAYMSSAHMFTVSRSLVMHLRTFQAQREPLVVHSLTEDLSSRMLWMRCHHLLAKLQGFCFPKDRMMQAWIDKYQGNLRLDKGNVAVLLAIEKRILEQLDALKAPELVMMHQIIEQDRAGNTKKSDRLTHLLFMTPLSERRHVISNECRRLIRGLPPDDASLIALLRHEDLERYHPLDWIKLENDLFELPLKTARLACQAHLDEIETGLFGAGDILAREVVVLRQRVAKAEDLAILSVWDTELRELRQHILSETVLACQAEILTLKASALPADHDQAMEWSERLGKMPLDQRAHCLTNDYSVLLDAFENTAIISQHDDLNEFVRTQREHLTDASPQDLLKLIQRGKLMLPCLSLLHDLEAYTTTNPGLLAYIKTQQSELLKIPYDRPALLQYQQVLSSHLMENKIAVLKQDCVNLCRELSHCGSDALLDTYVRCQISNIETVKESYDRLTHIKQELELTLKMLDSPEMGVIKNIIRTCRSEGRKDADWIDGEWAKSSFDKRKEVIYDRCQSLYHHLLENQRRDDSIFSKYLSEMKTNILSQRYHPAALWTLYQSMADITSVIHSSEVKVVQEVIAQLRAERNSKFQSASRERANSVEMALFSMPLLARGTLLTGRCNPVQEALAGTKRFLTTKLKVIKTADGQIDRRCAAKPYLDAMSAIKSCHVENPLAVLGLVRLEKPRDETINLDGSRRTVTQQIFKSRLGDLQSDKKQDIETHPIKPI